VADSTLKFESDVIARNRATKEEIALVAGLRSGAEYAYEMLILQYEQPVHSIVSRLVEHPADAPDVVQEVFLKVFRNVDHFREESSLKTWIYRIAVNEARNYRRWFGRHRRHEVGIEPASGDQPGVRDWIRDPGPSPFEIAVDHETRALVEEALAAISPGYRAVLVLREIEGLSYAEIGEILNLSLGTVKSRILRGRDALRKWIAERSAAAPRAWELDFGAQESTTA
jgi:RNA polymerase sigma-70 factor (ECF subfamily)